MAFVFWTVLWVVFLSVLIHQQPPWRQAAVAQGVAWVITLIAGPYSGLPLLCLGLFLVLFNTCLVHETYRHTLLRPLFKAIRGHLPQVSPTEQTALEAGDAWWEAPLFRGDFDWQALDALHWPHLSAEESSFLEGPCEQACLMANDWHITRRDLDLSPELWSFLKTSGFFGLVIPKQYGGRSFSAMAHGAVVTKLASKSITLATTVAVPNTLGPAELLMAYGTEEQKKHYLPALASGAMLPCFALTHPEAGSDASAIPDYGLVCRRGEGDQAVIGLELFWNKRYITLAPVADVLGLAFKLYDPEHLLGQTTELGITCALVPTHTPGVQIGARHFPLSTPFFNGPTQGHRVFVPLDAIIGGVPMIGQGWRMLMESLSAGRAITLPSSTCGAAKFGVLAAGAYAQIRQQFKFPIAAFEGIQEVLARIAGFTYIADATRLLTVTALDHNKKPSVASAIAKYHVTELARRVAMDVMDVHAGKGVIVGPNNHVAFGYESAPISITVEGANILTRNMIIFGQGALRCHPYLMDELKALQHDDFLAFDRISRQHLGWMAKNAVRALMHPVTGSRLASAPNSLMAPWYRHMARASSAYSLIADVYLIVYGGRLKNKESVSARLGDMLSYLYMSTACLKHFQEQGEPSETQALVSWSLSYLLHQFWLQMHALTTNTALTGLGRVLRLWTMPFGIPITMPSDRLNQHVAELMSTPTHTRDVLLEGMVSRDDPNEPAGEYEAALKACLAAAPLEKRLMRALKKQEIQICPWLKDTWIDSAHDQNLFSNEEVACLKEAQAWRARIIRVDDVPRDLWDTLQRTGHKAPNNTEVV